MPASPPSQEMGRHRLGLRYLHITIMLRLVYPAGLMPNR